MYKSARLIAGGAMVGSVLTATGFVLIQEQLRLSAAPPVNHHLFKYGIPEDNISIHAYKGHWLAYDNAKRIPVWVAELLNKDMVQNKTADRSRSKFKVDPLTPVEYQASDADYKGSCWVRGHMAAATNHAHDQQEMDETFYLSNIVPQEKTNNAGLWKSLENFCRELATCHDEVRLLTGPLFLPQPMIDEQGNEKNFVHYEVIGDNRVAMPTHLYKVIVLDDDTSTEPCLGAFIIPNKPIKGETSLKKYQVPLKELENYLGAKLLPQLNLERCRDLCTVSGCERGMSPEKYAQRLKGATDLNSLEEIWREMKESCKDRNDRCTKLYSQIKASFVNKNS